MLRDLVPGDLSKLDEIHKTCHAFNVPRLNNLIDDKIVANESGDIIGYGILKMFPEAIMILDTRRSLRERMEALNEFLLRAIQVASEKNTSQIHAFVEDDKFAHLLIERYRFQTVQSKALVLNLE